MSLQKLKAALKKVDLGEDAESIESIISGLVEAEKETKGKIKEYESLKETVGEHNLGEVIGLYDALDKQGLTTAESIVELKNKADGSEKTITQLKEEAEAFKAQVAEGTRKAEEATKQAERRELIADAKTSLIQYYVNGNAADIGVMQDVEAGKITRSNDGTLLWGGKDIGSAVDDMKSGREFLFNAAPSGTGVVSGNTQTVNTNGKPASNWEAVIAHETK